MDAAALGQIDDQYDNEMNSINSHQETVRGSNPKGVSGEFREHDGLPQVSTYFRLCIHRQEAIKLSQNLTLPIMYIHKSKYIETNNLACCVRCDMILVLHKGQISKASPSVK